MCHSILRDLQLACGICRHRPQAIVGISQPQARRELGEEDGRLQADPTQRRQVCGLTEETAAEHDVEIVFFQDPEHSLENGDRVLAIRVEGCHVPCALLQGVRDAGLQRGALTEIEGMPKDNGARSGGALRGGIGRAIVDNDYMPKAVDQRAHRFRDDARFAIGRYHNINVVEVETRNRRHFHLQLRESPVTQMPTTISTVPASTVPESRSPRKIAAPAGTRTNASATKGYAWLSATRCSRKTHNRVAKP